MKILDWQDLALEDEVLREPISDGNRMVLWRAAERDGTFRYWERIGNVARAEITSEQGLCATAAASVRARQRLKGVLGKLLQRLHGKGDRSFVLPNGASAEQCGERQTDLLLVWGEDKDEALDEARIQSLWPDRERYQRLGPNLFLVGGSASQRAAKRAATPSMTLPSECPRVHGEQLLTAARESGDRVKEATALTDLGVIALGEGDPQRAVRFLEEAMVLTRQLGDPGKEQDILGHLGMALLTVRQTGRAREIFEHGLNYARSTGDQFAEKVALERLGLTASSLGNPAAALTFFDQALSLTRQVGDRQQEANLLWHQAIHLAELGQRDSAIDKGQEAVALFGKLGKPQAGWYGAYLQKYRMGLTEASPGAAGGAGKDFFGPQTYLGGAIVGNVMAGQATSGASPAQGVAGPGLLRMAMSAGKAMTNFVGSGFKTSPVDVQKKRLETCAKCEHHTGLRCKICGCFTNVKSRMLHEQCPIGKWPA